VSMIFLYTDLSHLFEVSMICLYTDLAHLFGVGMMFLCTDLAHHFGVSMMFLCTDLVPLLQGPKRGHHNYHRVSFVLNPALCITGARCDKADCNWGTPW
jgi:hypothetical protein